MCEVDCVLGWRHSPDCIVKEGVRGLVMYLCVANGLKRRQKKDVSIQRVDAGIDICAAAFLQM